ncbi:hypothetical protein [Chryseobacterium cheonjiense]|uniref:Sugar-binding protein n=1 Tax=Chryseobacterium cheonjiense TaxID=2728845 RepID=A0A7Y0A4U7_9FLAO|nr:hypothetical protein [Chryseobacterium cheonjiense]NML56714.1 hypothetical protein [Chryseobacterium cheonjiense]
MRKIHYISLFLANFCGSLLFSQGTDGNFFSAPSAASIPSFINAPVSLSTGIPDINIPFFTLSTHNPSLGINTGISYHPNNSLKRSKASDVGLGWSLYGVSCLIYREVNPANGIPTDGYYYAFMGHNGKFLLKTGSSGEKYIVMRTQTQITITYNPTANSFTIIDESGNSYSFDRQDIAYSKYLNNTTPYTSTYYLSSIKDVNQVTQMQFEYLEDIYNAPDFPSPQIKSLKLKKVISPDFGSMEFTYNLNTSLRQKLSDPFQLETAELKNKAGKTIQKYSLQYSENNFTFSDSNTSSCAPEDVLSGYYNKRVLNSIQKYGTSSAFEKTEFEYNDDFFAGNYWTSSSCHCLPSESDNPKYLALGLLKTIKYPAGGQVRYEFEPNQYIEKKTNTFDPFTLDFTPKYIFPYDIIDRDAQVLEEVGTYNFDTHHATTVNFNLTANPDDSDGASYLMYCVNDPVYYTDSPTWDPGSTPFINIELTSGVTGNDGITKYMPGTNTFKVVGTGGGGTVTIKRIRYKSLPIPNYTTGRGVRIKKIEFMENNVPLGSETRNYSYQQFANTSLTSGFFLNSNDSEPVVYKNVKETVGENKGYVRYYFKTMEDTPENINADGNISPPYTHYNVLRNGLLTKKEIFDAAANTVAKEEYAFELYPVGDFYPLSESVGSIKVKNSIIKKQTSTSTAFFGQDAISTVTESVRDAQDLNVANKKTITREGEVLEENYTYTKAGSLRLWGAKIKDRLIMAESKKNGTTLAKTETKYDDTTHFYPTSQITYLPDNLSQFLTTTVYDIYDDKGNLLQYRSFPDSGSQGYPVTIIWGYNKTVPIAKIEGARLSDIPASLITTIVNASNEDADATAATEAAKEAALLNALNTFIKDPALSNFIVTAYTYDPLVGMTTTLASGGIKENYKYDSFGRLQKVVDANGITVKEYKYNNKN